MARPKLGESDTERVHLKISSDELEAIENWRYANRVPSKSEAIRRLCQIGLATDKSLPFVARDLTGLAEVWDRIVRAKTKQERDATSLEGTLSLNKLWYSFAELASKMKYLRKSEEIERALRAVAAFNSDGDTASRNLSEALEDYKTNHAERNSNQD